MSEYETHEPERTDITKVIPRSNSKLEELRDNRLNEIMFKPNKAATVVSDGMVEEAEDRNQKKRTLRNEKK